MEKTIEQPMTVPEFLAWAEAQPSGRYELVRGDVVAMAPERARHALTKQRLARALEDAVRIADLDCTVFPDGMTVVVDAHTAFEPDALVQCGQPVDLESTVVRAPVIVVEVLSPSSASIDMTEKLVDYFRVASVAHYVIVDTKRRVIIHHRRGGKEGEIETHIISEGALSLEPPGIDTNIDDWLLPESWK
jgi:Uma2 family endonuclease